jgi:hypothetical protein
MQFKNTGKTAQIHNSRIAPKTQAHPHPSHSQSQATISLAPPTLHTLPHAPFSMAVSNTSSYRVPGKVIGRCNLAGAADWSPGLTSKYRRKISSKSSFQRKKTSALYLIIPNNSDYTRNFYIFTKNNTLQQYFPSTNLD